MERTFDHTQKILVAVEIGAEPQRLADLPPTHAVFRRMSMPEIAQAAADVGAPAAPHGAGPDFRAVLNRHMGYWEERIPQGQHAFVHYAIGDAETIGRSWSRLAEGAKHLALLGIYHTEPQSSAYPASFPLTPAPSHFRPGEAYPFTAESIFWFNFFPAQPGLFEKTFIAWAAFQLVDLPGRGECNQLVFWEGKDRLIASGVDDFVQINLNRFTSLAGFLASARAAGERSFTPDPDYRWSGMLLRHVATR